MGQHKQLKEICEIIGHNPGFEFYEIYQQYGRCETSWTDEMWDYEWIEVCDVREIIFTPEFMDKYNKYFVSSIAERIWGKLDLENVDNYMIHMFSHLDNPVQYLYNLIKK